MSIPQNPAELTGYIVKTYHDKHRIDLPIMLEASRNLEKTEGFPANLTEQLDELYFIVESHLAKEENILFPMIEQGTRGMMLQGPISVMMSEHEILDRILDDIQENTQNFQSPNADLQGLYSQILQFKNELTEHAELEDNTLFPSVLK